MNKKQTPSHYERHKEISTRDRVLAHKNMMDFGLDKSSKTHEGLVRAIREIDYLWQIGFVYPYSAALSKNSAMRMGKQNRLYKRADVRDAQNDIILIVKNQLGKGGIVPTRAKVWISFIVEKSTMRGDAINVVDTICDAVKKAINIDDNWFAIERLDWKIVKHSPAVLIRIGQETTTPEWPCQACGEMSSQLNPRNDPFCEDCRGHRKVKRQL